MSFGEIGYTNFINNSTLGSKVKDIAPKFGAGLDIDGFTKLVNASTARLIPNLKSSDVSTLFQKLDRDKSGKVEYQEVSLFLDCNYDINLDVCGNDTIESVVEQIEKVDSGEIKLASYQERLKERENNRKRIENLAKEWNKFIQSPKDYIKNLFTNMNFN